MPKARVCAAAAVLAFGRQRGERRPASEPEQVDRERMQRRRRRGRVGGQGGGRRGQLVDGAQRVRQHERPVLQRALEPDARARIDPHSGRHAHGQLLEPVLEHPALARAAVEPVHVHGDQPAAPLHQLRAVSGVGGGERRESEQRECRNPGRERKSLPQVRHRCPSAPSMQAVGGIPAFRAGARWATATPPITSAPPSSSQIVTGSSRKTAPIATASGGTQ